MTINNNVMSFPTVPTVARKSLILLCRRCCADGSDGCLQVIDFIGPTVSGGGCILLRSRGRPRFEAGACLCAGRSCDRRREVWTRASWPPRPKSELRLITKTKTDLNNATSASQSAPPNRDGWQSGERTAGRAAARSTSQHPRRLALCGTAWGNCSRPVARHTLPTSRPRPDTAQRCWHVGMEGRARELGITNRPDRRGHVAEKRDAAQSTDMQILFSMGIP